jgi:plastocyanin
MLHRVISWPHIVVSTVVTVGLVGGAYAWEGTRAPAEGNGKYTIVMTDYRFAPDKMTWRVGQRVTITLINKSESIPPKPHEFMVGRVNRTDDTIFGVRYEDGYKTPFFDGVKIKLISGSGLTMLMAGKAIFTGISPKSVIAPGPMGPMEEMTGFMPLLGEPSQLTFSFIVPDKPGQWTYGCFQQSGEHFANGMKGTITILPRAAES